MTELQPGDRIRVTEPGDDGLPRVRYGWVGGMIGSAGPVVVMLDGELSRDIVDLHDELRGHALDTASPARVPPGLYTAWLRR